MNRKQTPDILADVMGSPTINNKAIKPESNKAVIHDSNKTVLQDELERNKAIKEKVTFNLSVDLMDDLEDVRIKLRREKRSTGTRVTKTSIVEAAIKNAINDYETRGEDSDLFKSL